MAIVNNATGVYSTLGFSYSDPNNQIVEFSANTQAHLNTVPPVIVSWQAKDIADNNVGGYYKNPVSNSIHFMSDTANTLLGYSPIVGDTGDITQLFTNILANCSFLSIGNETYQTQNVKTFLYHTDRLSNIRSQTDDAAVKIDGTNLPYFATATQAAKSATYIVNQTDGIANNSVMLGSFTSILEANQINQLANTVYSGSQTIIRSLTLIPVGEGMGSDYWRSNLSFTAASTISHNFANIVFLMTDRETADKAFYVNLKGLIDKYNTTKQLVNMGESEKYLVNNLIGTDKTKLRIN
jgi:hypothetical protein